MNQSLSFFSADYRDGAVYISGKKFSSGYFAVQLLNQYYKDDTAVRISVFKRYNWKITDTLNAGYLNPEILPEAATEIQTILKRLPLVQPFKIMNIAAEEKRVTKLLTEQNGNLICDYFRRRAKVGEMQSEYAALDMLPHEYDKGIFAESQKLIDDILSTLRFYDSIGNDMQMAFNGLIEFIGQLDNAKRLDEANLLPIAEDVFEKRQVLTQMDYAAIKNNKSTVMVRRIQFANYYSFILTDFYEGLHSGHYPKKCPICKRYFLMESARRQQYCNGYAPMELTGGKKMLCRKYAAWKQLKENAEGNPILAIHKRRMNYIRTGVSRGVLLPEVAQTAKEYAIELKEEAMLVDDYARRGYEKDMELKAFFGEVEKRLK